MEQMHVIVLRDIMLASCSIYDLMRFLAIGSSYVDLGESSYIYPLYIELNEAVLTKETSTLSYPKVSVRQEPSVLTVSCTCANRSDALCVHQVEVLDAILKRDDYRIFFDDQLRDTRFRSLAKGYGLENEKDIDAYFQLRFDEGKAQIFSRQKELFRVDQTFLKQPSFARSKSHVSELLAQSDLNKWILVLSKHRFYDQINFLLFEASTTQQGKLKNPLQPVDLTRQLLQDNDIATTKFLTALLSYQNRFEGHATDTELLALKIIASNPMGLAVYYHDRSKSENVAIKSLFPVKLAITKPELKLTVLKKDPFYEISSALSILGVPIPISQLVLKNDCFILFKHEYIYIADTDLLRVIQFLKSNNEILLIHSTKYEAFVSQFLAPVEDYVHIEYDYIHVATPVQQAECKTDMERILYLQKEGTFISITPVVRYGEMEVPVYSQKQLYSTDAVGNRFKIKRDTTYENIFTALVLHQHADFEEQLHYAQYFYLHKDKFFDDSWFLAAFDSWRGEGISILGFKELEGTRISPYTAKVDIKVNSGKDWFNVHVKLDFGGQIARIRQIQRAFKNKSKYVELDDGTYGLLPDEWMHKISKYFSLAHLEKELLHIPKIRFSEVAAHFENEILTTAVREELNIFQRDFLEATEIPKVAVPEGLKTILRSYQQDGFNWLCFLDRFGFGGCLADDMGLGKTVQVIAFLLWLKIQYKGTTNLIVVPTSLLFNWEDELNRFAPKLRVLHYNNGQRSRQQQVLTDYDVVLVSYGVLTSDISTFKREHFQYVFLDEGQLIKNPNSERYKTVCLLKSNNRIVLTGTPVENGTFDIYGLFSFACPGLLGNKQFFKDTYATPIDQFDFKRRAEELEQRIAPFILRRTKSQVIQELPEKTEAVIYCEMNDAQRSVYTSYEEEIRNYITATNPDILDNDRLHVLAFLTKLRQICNSPALLQEGDSASHSVKIDVLLEQILGKIQMHKILVFSQFVGMLDLIKDRLDAHKIAYSYLTGQSKDRKAIVAEFQQNEGPRVFLISLKAGGVGLNLTEADYVYLVDPWWNPAVESQAIDRIYRIGQDKKVTAVRLICTNTIEEKIIDLKLRKQKLASDLISSDMGWLNDLSKDELLSLVSAMN
ncbi:Superfamily II DNA or RNA helicase, SNF2 family [Sphingobacterium nematocida]|uniref:Superfamily II DNA or RNA helicase, SNF2 family n=1 Tax=Sphingobacterium nematocida TaxID=1513896 RepID=A0A1T5BMG0_9SPHI|nr:DEAD/DEAH box helicase [Sphingobacterium nematocida]SKB48456.1 Superfamily II DNA or RNA helicase, SNF2 family [Sphingobacterium nematocida]